VLLGRRERDRLPASARVWIAGCGTQQAVQWALCFPEGDILATDVSEASLGISSRLAEQLGISNIRFQQRDLMEPGSDGLFDLIVCTGVVHHLPEPQLGMRQLRMALEPDGAAVVMVYSRMHREPLAVFRRLLGALARPDEDDDARFRLACQLLDELLDGERVSPLCPGALEMLREHARRDRAFVADALLHPLEHSYDLDGFFELLDGAGLRHVSWLNPAQWRLASYLDSESLLERSARLEPVAEWRAVYDAAGYAAPLLEAVVQPTDGPERAPYGPEDLLALPLACCRRNSVVRVEGGRVSDTGEVPTFLVEGEFLRGKGNGPFGARHTFRLPAYVEPLLAAFDGTRAAGQAVRPFVEEFGEPALTDLITALSPLDVGLLAPLW
jgi:SAM-dependent methyltransferase